jgi:hypothetical protein
MALFLDQKFKIYMGGEIPKGGGGIFIGDSPPGGGDPRNIAPLLGGGENLLGGGGNLL